MPRTTTKSPKKTKAGANATAAERHTEAVAVGEVLTLAEAAAYLRVSEEEVKRLMRDQGLPGRAAGDDWRFLKTAVQDWLRTPPAKSSKEALLAIVGSWKDDPYLDDMLKEIYRKRRQPVTEDGA
jgi:excisionase family DNA binding protein